MLRLQLQPADLRRIRFSGRLHPLGTTVLACQALRDPELAASIPAVAQRRVPRAAVAPVHHLLPMRGRLPDFLTPWDGLESVDAGLNVVRATPKRRIRTEVTAAYTGRVQAFRAGQLATSRPTDTTHAVNSTELRRRFASADPEVIDLLLAALRCFFDRVLAPDWSAIAGNHTEVLAQAAHTYATSGVDGLLPSLHPRITWRPPMLEIETWWNGDVPLEGAGLVLVPHPFAGTLPRVLIERDRPALVVYPVATAGPAPVRLGRLLGSTRCAVLRALAQPGRHTTSGLARALGISISSSSEHATALRDAGLVTSQREGGAMVHALTPLGQRLLRQPAASPQ